MTRTPAALRLLAWLAGELTVLAIVVGTGGSAVDTPPLDADITRWWASREPLDAAAGVGKLLVVALTAYLVAVTSLHLVALLVQGRRLNRLASAVGPRFLAGVAATATLAAGTALAAAPAGAADAPSPNGTGVRMEVVAPDAQTPTTTAPTAAAPTTTAPTTTVLDTIPTTTAAPSTDAAQPEPPPPPAAVREAIVQPGDSMWTIARDEIASQLGHAPTAAEIDPYWRALIAANRDRLVHPDNPSLIYPGQSFVLP